MRTHQARKMPLIGITPDVRTAVVSPSDSKGE